MGEPKDPAGAQEEIIDQILRSRPRTLSISKLHPKGKLTSAAYFGAALGVEDKDVLGCGALEIHKGVKARQRP